MIVTEKILLQGMSVNGSWSNKQLNLLGIQVKRNKGWKRKFLDSQVDIPEATVNKFIALKDSHLKERHKKSLDQFLDRFDAFLRANSYELNGFNVVDLSDITEYLDCYRSDMILK